MPAKEEPITSLVLSKCRQRKNPSRLFYYLHAGEGRTHHVSCIICISEDQVYVEEETHREEYVLSETGRIWLGTVGKFCVRPWNFGQVTITTITVVVIIIVIINNIHSSYFINVGTYNVIMISVISEIYSCNHHH